MTTTRVTIRYMALLIATYLLVSNATGAGALITKGAAGVTQVGTGFTRALQGRSR